MQSAVDAVRVIVVATIIVVVVAIAVSTIIIIVVVAITMVIVGVSVVPAGGTVALVSSLVLVVVSNGRLTGNGGQQWLLWSEFQWHDIRYEPRGGGSEMLYLLGFISRIPPVAVALREIPFVKDVSKEIVGHQVKSVNDFR